MRVEVFGFPFVGEVRKRRSLDHHGSPAIPPRKKDGRSKKTDDDKGVGRVNKSLPI